jgi:hypothetical protein
MSLYKIVFYPIGNAPMFTIPNVVFPVAEYFLEDIIKFTRYWFILLYVYMYMYMYMYIEFQ